jgi:hypothetical protein
LLLPEDPESMGSFLRAMSFRPTAIGGWRESAIDAGAQKIAPQEVHAQPQI